MSLRKTATVIALVGLLLAAMAATVVFHCQSVAREGAAAAESAASAAVAATSAAASEDPPAAKATERPAPSALTRPPAAPRAESPPTSAAAVADADRFDVRSSRAGSCRAAGTTSEHAALLASFEERVSGELTIRADPSVAADVPAWIADEVRRPNRRFAELFDSVSLPLSVYVYRDVAQLHRFACVNPAADAYYDGALHVSAVPRDGGSIRNVVAHELVHHALTSRGVTRPTWLQEGLAMHVASERWWLRRDLQLLAWAEREHLPFAAMVPAFPDGADETFAHVAYFQSIAMVFIVGGGPAAGRGGALQLADAPRLRELVDALAAGRVSPEDAFAATLRAAGEEAEDGWKRTVARLAASAPRPREKANPSAGDGFVLGARSP
jgi:hypothetical protein